MRCPSLKELPLPPEGKSGWPWTIESYTQSIDTSDVSEWPKVSVVTPSYNQAEFIEETIRSILLQGYPNLEYLVVDGGSNDGTLDIILKYAPWIFYWVSEPDEGQSDALNKGIKRASGKYFGWLNSDDTYQPNAIINAVTYLLRNPSTDVVYSDCRIIDVNSQVIGKSEACEFKLKNYLFRDFISQQTAFINFAALNKIGGLDTNLHYQMDHDLFLRLGNEFKLRRITGTWGNFRVTNNTKSVAGASGFCKENVAVLKRFFANPSLPDKIRELEYSAYARAYLHGACREYGANQIEEAQNHLRDSIKLDPEWWQDTDRAEHLLTGWASYPVVGDPLNYITNVYNNLPEYANNLKRIRHKAIARAAIWLSFSSYNKGELEFVRRAIWKAVRNDPSWALNRGVMSIWIESIFGKRLVDLFRKLV